VKKQSVLEKCRRVTIHGSLPLKHLKWYSNTHETNCNTERLMTWQLSLTENSKISNSSTRTNYLEMKRQRTAKKKTGVHWNYHLLIGLTCNQKQHQWYKLPTPNKNGLQWMPFKQLLSNWRHCKDQQIQQLHKMKLRNRMQKQLAQPKGMSVQYNNKNCI